MRKFIARADFHLPEEVLPPPRRKKKSAAVFVPAAENFLSVELFFAAELPKLQPKRSRDKD